MKVRNKKTGEIVNIADLEFTSDNFAIWLCTTKYNSLAELNEEWEDYQEPKKYYFLTTSGGIAIFEGRTDEQLSNDRKQIGNYFETKEEAEKAVEKLKGFKRLKDLGFRFDGIRWCDRELHIKSNITTPHPFTKEEADEFNDCLHKVFGGDNEISQ